MVVPVHFYKENTGHGTFNEVVKHEFNALNRNAGKSIQTGVWDCYAYLLSSARQSTHSPLFQSLTTSALYHYCDGIGGGTVVLYGIGGDQSGAMTMIVAFKFALTRSTHVHTVDIQDALARFQRYPGIWL